MEPPTRTALTDAPDSPYGVSPWNGNDAPLVVQARDDTAVGPLCAWLERNGAWVQDRLHTHGALLFRGFTVQAPEHFERVARAVAPALKNDYLGTSPRNALTPYVFNASELPGHFPIPQHCEMSFVRNPPANLFFCCLRAPMVGSGETPIADFRKVLRSLDPALVARFETRGLRIVRNYSGPSQRRNLDPWQLKRWDEMFRTTDRAEVERRCRDEGFEPVWTRGDGLRLLSTQPITRVHPVTGERVWFNHLTTFHVSQAVGEYTRIVRARPTLRHLAILQLAHVLERVQRARPPETRAMHCTYADGSEIPDADVDAVRDAVWRNLIAVPWREGDVLAIDNFAMSHGRLPYTGPRHIAVAWA